MLSFRVLFAECELRHCTLTMPYLALFFMIDRHFAFSEHIRPVSIILQLTVVSAPSLPSFDCVADRGRVALATSDVNVTTVV